MIGHQNESLRIAAARIRRLVTAIMGVIVALVLIVPPAGYLLVNYVYIAQEARTHASTSAELLSRLIYGHGGSWRFETDRLEEILTRTYTPGNAIYQQVVGLNGRTIIETGAPPAWPAVTGEAAINESAWRVGTLRVALGLRPTLLHTAIVAALSLLAALATLLAGRTLPLRMVEQAFQRLEESQAQLKLSQDALEQSNDSIIIADRSGAVQYANGRTSDAWATHAGAKALNHLDDWLEGAEQVRFADVLGVAGGGDIWTRRYRRRTGDGAVFESEGTCFPILNPSGNIANFIFIEKDITEQLQIETRLRNSQRLESLGTLAGGIAHDFNNILQPILGYIELLQLKTSRESGHWDWLLKIRQAAYRARDLVARIQMFSRRTQPDRVATHLGEIVQEVAGLLRTTIPLNVELRTHMEDGLPAVLVDSGQMHQLVLNLLLNAIQAMPDGGYLDVYLQAVDLHDKSCLHGASLSGRYLKLRVEDTGVGMDETTVSRIFEPFFSTKLHATGTGLGLATVYGIVLNHHGGLDVNSAVGVGTQFEVYLPALALDAQSARASTDEPKAASGRILVVDDESANAELLGDYLEQLGYVAETYTDPLDALHHFRSCPTSYHLLITDKAMQGLSGEELIGEVRRINLHLPVILCSGYPDPQTPYANASMLADEILTKPVSLNTLASAVARVIAQRA